MNRLSLLLKNVIIALSLLTAFSCGGPVPTIIFTTPTEGQQYFKDSDIDIKVIIADTKGKTFPVQLYVDDILFDELPKAPYYFTIKAGKVLPGNHTVKITVKDVAALRTISVSEANYESPDFVTFAGGKIPPEWSVENWRINIANGVDDKFSLIASSPEAQATTSKTCNKISFYLRGNGTVNLKMDGTLLQTIQLIPEVDTPIPALLDWTLFEFHCPQFCHTFTWEYVGGLYVFLDAISFEKE